MRLVVHVVTYNGNLPQLNKWTDTWEEYFTNNFKHFLEMEHRSQGPATEELTELSKAMVEKVIPRLLRPLETGGRHIEPSLIQYVRLLLALKSLSDEYVLVEICGMVMLLPTSRLMNLLCSTRQRSMDITNVGVGFPGRRNDNISAYSHFAS